MHCYNQGILRKMRLLLMFLNHQIFPMKSVHNVLIFIESMEDTLIFRFKLLSLGCRQGRILLVSLKSLCKQWKMNGKIMSDQSIYIIYEQLNNGLRNMGLF